VFRTLANAFRVPDLRRRLLYTLFAFVIFRIGSYIPVPGIDVASLHKGLASSALFGLFDAFSGRALSNFSLFAMGVMPYITASIIVQLLSMDVIPALSEWAKEGEVGRRKLAQVTRYLTAALAFLQAIGFTMTLQSQYHLMRDPGVGSYLLIALTLTTGTMFLMWLGEQITEKGIGNGISLLIFAGIAASIPSTLEQIYVSKFFSEGSKTSPFLVILGTLFILLLVVILFAGVIFVQEGIRRIPVQYAKRVVGRRVYGGQMTHIPLRVNSAGVIPVIFAVSILMFPSIIASFFPASGFAQGVARMFAFDAPLGLFLYVTLIVAFTYFYTYVQLNPQQLTENLQKQGGFIPGVRSGKATEAYLTRVINRITLFGGVFLSLIAVLPVFFTDVFGLPGSVRIGGTSLLILIGVALETMKTIESQLVRRHYEGFLR